MDDSYLTIRKASRAETKVKGSRFIARTFLTRSVDEANGALEKTRKEEHAATHNCYAWVVGIETDKTEFKYSDDGEPNGTAGRPIYDAVCGAGVTNVLVIVTRYFGGTKLGTGGLVRAYSEAAKLALESAGKKENLITDRFNVEVEFRIYDNLKKVMSRLEAREVEAVFSDRVTATIEIRRSRSQQLEREIVELSKGKAKIEKVSQE